MKHSTLSKLSALFLGIGLTIGVFSNSSNKNAVGALADTSTGSVSVTSGAFPNDWTASGLGKAYADGSAKFDGQGDYVENKNLFSDAVSSGMTKLEVDIQYKWNSGSGDQSTNAMSVTPFCNNSYGTATAVSGFSSNSSTKKTITISSNLTNCTGFKLTYSNKGNGNIGVYSISWTATYTAGQAKTISSLALSGSVTAFTTDTSWNYNGLTVTATYTDSTTGNVTAGCTFSSTTAIPSSAGTGNASIKATHTSSGKTVTTSIPYTVTKGHSGTSANDAFTVEEAIKKIDAKTLDASTTYYTKGKYCRTTTDWSSQFSNLSVDVSDTYSDNPTKFIRFYRMKASSKPSFTNGEEIIASAVGSKYTLYSGTTYELNECDMYEVLATVTYNANGGDGTMANGTGKSVTIANNSFTPPTGKHFKNWNTSPDGSGTTYAPGTSVTTDLTLYAIWEINTYTITKNLVNCSSSNAATSATHGSTFTTTITAQANYELPDTITVNGGTKSWDSSTGALSVSNITGNVTISITATLHKYTLTTSGLSHMSFTQSNGSSLEHGKSFSGTLTPDAGWKLEGATVSVTMGGSDITLSAYSNGTISIGSVTGDIVIYGSAAEILTSTLALETDSISVEGGKSVDLKIVYSHATLTGATISLKDGINVASFGQLNTTSGVISVTGSVKGDGDYTIKVSYLNQDGIASTIDLDVSVNVYVDEVLSISLSPTSGTYYLGDKFVEPTVTAIYSLTGNKTVTATKNKEFDPYTTGTQIITYTFEGQTATYTATVNAKSYDTTTDPITEWSYDKVTSAQTDWRGRYLIVYDDSLAFDGSLETLDATENSKSVTVTNNSIKTSSESGENFDFEIGYKGSSTSIYYLKASNGKYLSGTTVNAKMSNGLSTNNSNANYEISFNGINLESKSSDGQMALRYNKANDQKRFRFYKSGQEAVSLFKLTKHETPGSTIHSDEKHAIRIANASCTKAELIAGEALTPNDFNISVQYDTGMTLVENLKPTSVSPTTVQAGTCDYTLTYTGSYNDTVTKTISLTSKDAPIVSSIAVSYESTWSNEFVVGETFNHSGVKITASYSNGYADKDVTSDASFTAPDLSTIGEKTVNVSYTENGKTVYTSYLVNCVAPEKVVSGITVKTNPAKTTYNVGESFDPTGLVITANYTNSYYQSEDITYNDTNKTSFNFNKTTLAASDSAVTVTYGGKTASIPVSMKCLVSLNPHGGTFDENDWTMSSGNATKYFDYNSPYGELPNVSKTGYDFAGWFTQETGGSAVSGNVLDSVTLHAQWSAKAYTLTLNANGGLINDQGTATQQVSYNGTYGTLPTPTRFGYDFYGWFDSLTDGSQVTSATVHNVDGNATIYAHWTPHTSTFVIDVNGGTITDNGSFSGSPLSVNATYGTSFGTMPTAEYLGYNFNGWYIGDTKVDTGSTVTFASNEAISLVAHWSEDTMRYHVTYNNNGVTSTMPTDTTEYRYKDKVNAPTTDPTATGYTFGGWYTEAACGELSAWDFANNVITDDLTLYAKWTPINYAIHFNYSGKGVNTDTTADYGTHLTAPDNTDYSGYTFNGWYTDSQFGEQSKWDFDNDTVSGETTLYAKYDANTYAVLFDGKGGNVSFESKEVTFNTAIGELPTASLAGHTFVGWFTEAGTQYNAETILTNPGTITLYAHYSINSYELSYDLQGHGSAINPTSHEYDTCATAPTTPTATGYTFGGWYKDSACTEAWNFDVDKVLDDTTIYAKWTPITSTVTLNANGGECPSSIEVTYDSTYAELPTPVRHGYTFDGWYTELNGGTKVETTDTVVLTTDSTLYAHWTAVDSTITFNANGASNAPSEINTKYDTQVTLPGVGEMVKEGYTFAGWNTASDGTGTSYEGGASFTAGDNVTLYAMWTADDHAINVTATNLNVTGDNTIKTDGTATITLSPKEGYGLPLSINDISVTNATLVSYENGVITISNPTGDVTISTAADNNALVSISLSQTTVDVDYGGTLNLPDVIAHYKYTDDKNVTNDVTVTGFDPHTLGEQIVTITYTEGDVTLTEEITVNVNRVLDHIEVVDYTFYTTENEEFNFDGKVIAYYTDTEVGEEVTQGYTLSTLDVSTKGNQTVTVTFGNKSQDINIKVVEKVVELNQEQKTTVAVAAVAAPSGLAVGFYFLLKKIKLH